VIIARNSAESFYETTLWLHEQACLGYERVDRRERALPPGIRDPARQGELG
jgi:hypothetical protein